MPFNMPNYCFFFFSFLFFFCIAYRNNIFKSQFYENFIKNKIASFFSTHAFFTLVDILALTVIKLKLASNH